MTICVKNCLNWIGFHIVNRLLEDGCQVDGIVGLNADREEDLSMMLGRNSLFSLYNENQIKQIEYTDMIILDEINQRSIPSIQLYDIRKNMEGPTISNIKLPLLFGEWMPMDDNGVYVNDQYIEFDSDKFREEAIYIDDFMGCLIQWMKVPEPPQFIFLTKDKDLRTDVKPFEQQMYIRESSTIGDQIINLKKHYHKIKNFNI